jgi:hypothetical protein
MDVGKTKRNFAEVISMSALEWGLTFGITFGVTIAVVRFIVSRRKK